MYSRQRANKKGRIACALRLKHLFLKLGLTVLFLTLAVLN